ncbi:MAG: flagellar hook-associated protein 3 [Rubrivivax sp.]|jgi:flagellar hook-associated protein 3 FlgL|nr:flagellar hook-associated protein 3 [Rubrivivax sp.]
MTVRITTAMSFNNGLTSLQQRQRELAEAQERLTTGKRVQRASDDPTAAARAERALVTLSRMQADLRALEASRNAMTLTESALGDAAELLQQARELMVAAGNASYSPGEREALATQLEGIRAQLLGVANRRDESGGYLFFPEWPGPGTPLVDGPPVAYAGTAGPQGERLTAGREALPLNVDGSAGWRIDASTGESALFAGFDAAIAALRQTAPVPEASTIAAAGIDSVDASLETLGNLRARVGELLNRADMIESRALDLELYAQSERSAAEDLDLVQAVSDFQTRQTSYDAALKTYNLVQRLSMFDYLNP